MFPGFCPPQDWPIALVVLARALVVPVSRSLLPMASSSADHCYPDGTPHNHKLVASAARSVAHSALRPLPAFQKKDARGNFPVTLCLFYQYIEPLWTVAEHKEAMKFVIGLGKEHGICGRGRCAAEGLNCSLTGSAKGIRAFCEGLRKWKPIFSRPTSS